METSGYACSLDAERIILHCVRVASVKDIDALMRLFNSLQDNEKAIVKKWKDLLKSVLDQAAMMLQQSILKDNVATKKLQDIFERWRRERLGIDDTDDDEAIVDDDDDDNELSSFSKQEFE